MPQRIAHSSISIDATKLSEDDESRIEEFKTEVTNSGGRLPGSGRVNPESLDLQTEITITNQLLEQLFMWSTKLNI